MPLLMHRQFINCLALSISSHQILLNSSISWQSFAWCSRKSLFLISNSPYKLILSLWAWSANWFLCCCCNRWDSNSWVISLRAISECLFSQCLSSTSASASYNLCWASSSPFTANSAFRSRNFVEILPVSKCLHNVLISISLLLWHRLEKTWKQLFHDTCPHKSPWC